MLNREAHFFASVLSSQLHPAYFQKRSDHLFFDRLIGLILGGAYLMCLASHHPLVSLASIILTWRHFLFLVSRAKSFNQVLVLSHSTDFRSLLRTSSIDLSIAGWHRVSRFLILFVIVQDSQR